MTAKIYTKTCIYWLLGLLLFSALANRVVDPFWYYRDVEIKGFNAEKPQFYRFERQFKPILLKETKPETVVFSSSFLEIGFNPKHPALTQDGAYRSYNFGIVAADYGRVFCNVMYALENTQLKTAIIGVHPTHAPKFDCSAQMKTMGTVDNATLLLSYAALKASYKTLVLQNKKPTETKDGLLFYNRDKGYEVELMFRHFMNKYRTEHPDKTCTLPQGYTGTPAWAYPASHADMEGLKFLLQQLVAKNVKTKLVVYPFHAIWLELEMACGDVMTRWHALYEMAKLVDEINQSHPGAVELWDFQGMGDFMVEKIRNNEVKYWQDHGHFNYEMGDVMLDTIFRRNPSREASRRDEFGVMLTSEIVPGRFNRFFAKRQEYIAANPWFRQELGRFLNH